MKKVLMLLVACCLVFNTTVMCAFAETQDIDFSMSTVKEIIANGGDHLMEILDTDRASAFLVMRGYFSTDEGVDTLIELIENDMYNTVPAVENIFNIIGDKETFIFMIKLIKCIDADERAEVLDAFYAREGLELTSKQEEALYKVYEYFVPEEVITTLADENNVTAEMIAALFNVFKGKIMLTDTEYGSSNFKLKSMSSGFTSKLNSVLDEYTVGGKSYKAKAFVNKIIDDVNEDFSKTAKNNIKVVFEEIGIYEEAKKPSSSSSGGGGGYSVITEVSENVPTAGEVLSPVQILAQFAYSGVEVEEFDDAVGHWSNDTLRVLRAKGIIAGDAGTNNYRPDARINREEMAVLMARYLQMRDGINYETHEHIKFADSDSVSPWATSSVAYLAGRGILLGYPDGNYKPQQEITREEAIAIIDRVINNKYKTTHNAADFTDHHTIGDWAKEDVEYMSDLKIVSGYETGAFMPKNFVTRAEVSTLVFNAMCVEGMIK
ncbi:MAG: hypothetical protein E7416_04840 [Ruminococcaceae bacterium]|nr:hypothetical protein [Oscillospiraceae bacterium]